MHRLRQLLGGLAFSTGEFGSDRWAFTSAKGSVPAMVTSMTMLQAIR